MWPILLLVFVGTYLPPPHDIKCVFLFVCVSLCVFINFLLSSVNVCHKFRMQSDFFFPLHVSSPQAADFPLLTQ